ncbi:MAG: hypothetical protein JXC85_05730 [Candidatus Aenigmarchaeota archaeon]|nr:hypothetical protein [Candidatus Aenigmarchaeota archaeon]
MKNYIVSIIIILIVFSSGCVIFDNLNIKRSINIENIGTGDNFRVDVSIENQVNEPIIVNEVSLVFDEDQFTCIPQSQPNLNLQILPGDRKVIEFDRCEEDYNAVPGEFLIKGILIYTRNNIQQKLDIEGAKRIVE